MISGIRVGRREAIEIVGCDCLLDSTIPSLVLKMPEIFIKCYSAVTSGSNTDVLTAID